MDVIIHKEAIGTMGAADDNIRSEHWDELAVARNSYPRHYPDLRLDVL